MQSDNTFEIHWKPGHKVFEGNKRADRLAKEVANEMVVNKRKR